MAMVVEGMTKEEARSIVKRATEQHLVLFDACGEAGRIGLDGDFSAQDLYAIAWWSENGYNEDDLGPPNDES